MRNKIKGLGRATCVVALAASLGACSDWITDVPGNRNVVENPTVGQLFTAAQLGVWLVNEGHMSRLTSMWLNQAAGVDRQFLSLDEYVFGEDELEPEWTTIYPGGGLYDIRLGRTLAADAGLTHTEAIFKIHEAFLMGMTASMFGDIPYSEASNPEEFPQPNLDPQEQVYASVQALLDEAIAALSGPADAGDAPLLGARDMSFGGNAALWIQAANSLKARFYMHWVEAQAAGLASANIACGGNCLTKALAAAQNGIDDADENWMSVHSTGATETNWWYQFNVERAGYIAGGELLIDSLEARNDPRLPIYFTQTGTTWEGSAPGEGNSDAATINITDGFAAPDAGMALVTCAETQFIIAEVQYRLGNTAAANAALQAGIACQEDRFNVNIPNPPALSGAALLHEIMMQKYMALYLNMEAFNDYKRTCQPNVAAVKVANDTDVATEPLPRRFMYGQSERLSNPNVPVNTSSTANENDPVSCTTVLGLPGA